MSQRSGFGVGAVSPIIAALVLGVVAFITDILRGLPHEVLLGLTSKGFVWAAGAVVVGLRASTARRAGITGAATLVGATVVYYSAILAFTDRWRAGIPIDGSSPVWYGLKSVIRASQFWSAASVAVGALLGVAGWVAVSADARLAAWTAGALGGVMASGGVYVLSQSLGRGPGEGWWVRPAVAALTAVASLGGAAVVAARRGGRPWGRFAAASLVALAVCVPLWAAVSWIRNSHL